MGPAEGRTPSPAEKPSTQQDGPSGTSRTPGTAMVFPGMGRFDFSTAGRFLVLDPYARERLAIAEDVLGFSVLERFHAAGADYSAYSQLAFLVCSLAAADRAEDRFGVRPDVCVGASFGQKSAATYAGSLDFADALRLTLESARCEEDYFSSEYTDVVTHSVYRVPDEEFHDLLERMRAGGEWLDVSGTMDEGFYMVSLRESRLDEFIADIRELGGYSLHTMRPPVHASAFGALRAKADAEVYSKYEVRAPSLPVVSDADGAMVETAEAMRTMLLDTFDRAIRWPDIVATLVERGVETLYVTGADDTFHRLRCTSRNFDVVTVNPKNALRPGPPKLRARTAA